MNRRDFNKLAVAGSALAITGLPNIGNAERGPYRWEIHMTPTHLEGLMRKQDVYLNRLSKTAFIPRALPKIEWLERSGDEIVFFSNSLHLPTMTLYCANKVYNWEEGKCVKDRNGFEHTVVIAKQRRPA